MGTSKRKIDEKIKKILNNHKESDYQVAIPEVVPEIMTRKPIRSYFGQGELEGAVGGAIKGLTSIVSGKFQDEYGYDGAMKNDAVTIQKIVGKILDAIDTEIKSDLLDRALRYALAVAVKEGGNDKLLVFTREFTIYFLYLLISENIIEALGDEYQDKSTADLDKSIKKLAERIVLITLEDDIRRFISGRISITDLIGIVGEKVSKIKPGDF